MEKEKLKKLIDEVFEDLSKLSEAEFKQKLKEAENVEFYKIFCESGFVAQMVRASDS